MERHGYQQQFRVFMFPFIAASYILVAFEDNYSDSSKSPRELRRLRYTYILNIII
jgi:hypothetical protein